MSSRPTSLAAHRAGPRLAETVRSRHRAGAARRQLRRELAAFSTQAEVNDLLALIAESDDPMADEIRNILTANLLRCA